MSAALSRDLEVIWSHRQFDLCLRSNDSATVALIDVGNDNALEATRVLVLGAGPGGGSVAVTSVAEFIADIRGKKVKIGRGTTAEAEVVDRGQTRKVTVALDQIHAPRDLADRGKDCWLRCTRAAGGNEYVAGCVKELRRTNTAEGRGEDDDDREQELPALADAPAAEADGGNEDTDGAAASKSKRDAGSTTSTSICESYVHVDPYFLITNDERDPKAQPMPSGWYPAADTFRRLSVLDVLQRETVVCPLTRIVVEAPSTDYDGFSRHTGPLFYTEDPVDRIVALQQKFRELMHADDVTDKANVLSEQEADEILRQRAVEDRKQQTGGRTSTASEEYHAKHHEARMYAQEQLKKSASSHPLHGDENHVEVEVSRGAVRGCVGGPSSSANRVVSDHKKELAQAVLDRHEAAGGNNEADEAGKSEEDAAVVIDEVRYYAALLAKLHHSGANAATTPSQTTPEYQMSPHVKDLQMISEGTHQKALTVQEVAAEFKCSEQEALELLQDHPFQFFDTAFDCSPSCADGGRGTICSDCDPSGDGGYSKVADQTLWRRPWVKEVSPRIGEERLFPEFLIAADGVHESDIRQHNVGDCWFMSICAACAYREDPDFVSNLIHYSPEYGVYSVKLVIEGQLRWLLLDDRFPVEKGNVSNPKFVSSACQGELWPVLLEKAFAKWAGCYQNLRGGMQNTIVPIGSSRALEALTWGSDVREFETSKFVGFNKKSSTGVVDTRERLSAETLKELRDRRFVMTTGGCENALGLIPGHVFSLLDVHKLPLPRGAAGYKAFLSELASSPIADEERESENVLHFVNETGCGIRFRHFARETPTRGRGGVLPKTTKTYDFKLEGSNGKLKWMYETATAAKAFNPEETLNVRNGDTISFKQPNQVQGSQIRQMAGHEETAKMYAESPAGRHWAASGSGDKDHVGDVGEDGDAPTVEFVKVRNPWGHGEWTGLWGDASPVWNWYPELVESLNFKKVDDGVFLQQWEDFDATFSTVTACGHVLGSPLTMPSYDHDFSVPKSPAKMSKSQLKKAAAAVGRGRGDGDQVEVAPRTSVKVYASDVPPRPHMKPGDARPKGGSAMCGF